MSYLAIKLNGLKKVQQFENETSWRILYHIDKFGVYGLTIVYKLQTFDVKHAFHAPKVLVLFDPLHIKEHITLSFFLRIEEYPNPPYIK